VTSFFAKTILQIRTAFAAKKGVISLPLLCGHIKMTPFSLSRYLQTCKFRARKKDVTLMPKRCTQVTDFQDFEIVMKK
jgi:hypothetical protein